VTDGASNFIGIYILG